MNTGIIHVGINSAQHILIRSIQNIKQRITLQRFYDGLLQFSNSTIGMLFGLALALCTT
jgi:hypothetical protein